MLLKSIKSFRFAFKGILYILKSENNFRLHILATFLVITTGILMEINMQDWLWLIVAIGLVWIAEAFNSAIEKLVDIVSPEHNVNAGLVKDISAGAVLLASIIAAIIGLLILLKNI